MPDKSEAKTIPIHMVVHCPMFKCSINITSCRINNIGADGKADGTSKGCKFYRYDSTMGGSSYPAISCGYAETTEG